MNHLLFEKKRKKMEMKTEIETFLMNFINEKTVEKNKFNCMILIWIFLFFLEDEKTISINF